MMAVGFCMWLLGTFMFHVLKPKLGPITWRDIALVPLALGLLLCLASVVTWLWRVMP